MAGWLLAHVLGVPRWLWVAADLYAFGTAVLVSLVDAAPIKEDGE